MMSTRKSLALAIAIVGIGGEAAVHNVPAAAQSPSWSGPYVGGSSGGGFGQQSQSGGRLALPAGGSGGTTTFSSSTVFDGSYNLSGAMLGGTIGYNFQSDRVIYGVEADASWADISGNGTCGLAGAAPHACGGNIRGLETVRARLGYDLGPILSFDTMVFASGGLAVGQVNAWDALSGTSGGKSAAGWTVGGGLESKIGSNWSVTLEYLYADLGDPALFSTTPPIPEHVSTTVQVVRLGLDYNFNWTGPVVSSPPILKK